MKNRSLENEKTAALERELTSHKKSAMLDGTRVIGGEITGEDKAVNVPAVKSLQDCREFSHILLKNSLNQVMVVGPDTSVIYVNPSFEKLSGYTLIDIAGAKAPYPWWPEGSLEYIGSLMVRDAKTAGTVAEKQWIKKNGESFWVELSTTPVRQDGVLNYLLVNSVDITERRQMQDKLLMQDRLASVGHLSSGLAHEINNPLTSVITFSSLLLRRELSDDVKEDIKMIYDEAQRAAKIVNNLLAFVRRQPQEIQLVNINEGIQKALELRAYEQKVNNIRVDAQLASDLPVISGNSFRLQQVFINVIINAEFFMHEAHGKGTLTIKTEKIGNYVRASFADDGPGISKDDMAHLFAPFFTTKEVGKGTGLGLSICRSIMNEHNGRIRAESKPGTGSVFILELPVSPADDREPAALYENSPANM
jgi:PAS domain S-box-containing protein